MSVYYNENDAFAAQWLRNLIAEGLIAPGEVDERSIVDVEPTDLRSFRQCHFFAGIGGWSLALRLAGWPDDRPAWTGSCPCQPLSSAGQRKGHVDERHLWPAFHRLITECRPPVVLGEQVASADGREWLAAVRADLEDDRYAVGAADLCAAGVGAPHIRQRLWFVAQRVADADRARRQSGIEAASPAGHRHSAEPASGGVWSGAPDEPWRDADWLFCRDAKWRPVEPRTFPLASRLSEYLDRLRAIEADAIREAVDGFPDEIDPREVLRMVRRFLREETYWEAPAIRVREQLHASTLLFDFMLCVEAACDGPSNRSGFEKASPEARERIVRGVRGNGRSDSSSHRWRRDEQQTSKLTDTLSKLSLILARNAEVYRQEARNANAAACRLGALRGYGNAIVPACAAAFIRACM